ncbi:MAG: rod shape-determining protein [Deltaproteobacteria bacterium]|jgi:hypothetical protein|nr:rod shape-determining protein [Deltaproteobacteria bacterium]
MTESTIKQAKNVIGIDFGTTNTYVTVCPIGARNKFPLHLTGKNPAIDTGILYSDKPEADLSLFPMIGEKATITFGQADLKEIQTQGYRYRSEFKPDIERDQSARDCASDFFRALIRDAVANHTPLNAPENRVIIGAPAEANEAYRKTLAQIAKLSGLGEVEILDEPIGALLTELGSARIPLSDILEGYLVIDFGGGTCDFALLRRGGVVRSWGDMALGGRLFDDLFFRWFIDQNPKVLDEVRSLGREYFVRSYLCRNLKEEFSETIAKNPKASFRGEVGRFGKVFDLTREEFLSRAKNFALTQSFIDYYGKIGIPIAPKLTAKNIDLIDWFRAALSSGLKAADDIKAVTLSGGSSKWFFVKELCYEELKIDKLKILNTFNPFGAISEGLAILPAIQNEFETTIKKITADKPAFLANEIVKHVKASVNSCCNQIVDTILVELFDQKITPTIKSYAHKKFTLAQMETDITVQVQNYDSQLRSLIDRIFRKELEAVRVTAYLKLESWLGEYNLKTAQKEPSPVSSALVVNLDDETVASKLTELLSKTLAGVASALTTTLAATICGGTGLHLLAAGPVGLVMGAAGGLVLSGLGWRYGSDKLKGWAKNVPLPGYFLKLLASDRSIASLREDFGNKTGQKLSLLAGDFVERLTLALEAMIDTEIKNLGITNVF